MLKYTADPFGIVMKMFIHQLDVYIPMITRTDKKGEILPQLR